jgi:hypothetical protein
MQLNAALTFGKDHMSALLQLLQLDYYVMAQTGGKRGSEGEQDRRLSKPVTNHSNAEQNLSNELNCLPLLFAVR